MSKEEPTEPLAEIYKIWKELTFTYKGQRYHIGWPILWISILLFCGYLGGSVPLDYR